MTQKFNVGQEIVFGDFNDLQTRAERFIFDKVVYELMQRKTDGFFQDSFSSVFQNSTSILLKAGLGFMLDDTGTKEATKKPLVLESDQVINLNTPDVANPRIDAIFIKWNIVDGDSEDRKFKDEFTTLISEESFVVSLNFGSEVVYTAGTPEASPSAPATPAGYLKVCEMQVAASTGMASQASITDFRSLLPIMGSSNASGSSEYDKVVGSVNIIGVTHSSLKLALDNASDGEKILVLEDQEIDSIPVVNNNDIEIVFKRGVSIIKGTAIVGIQIDGNDCKLVNARISGFSTVGDKAIIVNGSRGYLDAPRFLNCDTEIDDQGTETYIPVSYTE